MLCPDAMAGGQVGTRERDRNLEKNVKKMLVTLGTDPVKQVQYIDRGWKIRRANFATDLSYRYFWNL